MKKILALALTLVMMLSFAACGNKDNGDTVTTDPAVTTDPVTEPVVEAVDPTDALTKIWNAISEDYKFAAAGGDANNMVMDGPGKYSLEGEGVAEGIDSLLGFPAADIAKIDNAASLMHMMNANTFTCGAYHYVDAADAQAAGEALKTNILARRWMCGFPETLIVIDLGGNTVLAAFGNGQLIEHFKTTALETIEGSKLVIESPIG